MNTKRYIPIIPIGLVLIFIVLTTGCVTTQQADQMTTDLRLIQQQLTQNREDFATLRKDMVSNNQLMKEETAKNIKELKNDTAGLKDNIDRIQKTQAEMNAKINGVSTDLQNVQGKLDENKDRISATAQKVDNIEANLGKRIDNLKTNVNKRLDSIEARVSPTPGVSPTPDTTVTPNEDTTVLKPEPGTNPVETPDPEKIYQTAYGDYVKGNYDVAVDQFKLYLQHFPEAENAAAVRYMLGDCYYSKKQFEPALAEFDKLIKQSPTSEKVPAAMLKRAYIYRELKKDSEAVSELKSVVKKYPLSPEADIAIEELKTAK
ncbi:MAG: tetratricopeptide repeat protein [bacterium]